MEQVLLFSTVGLLSGITLVALFQALAALFPRLNLLAVEALRGAPLRSFFIGLANVVFFAVITLISLALNDNTGIRILVLPALVIITLFAVFSLLSLSAFASLLGERLQPTAPRAARLTYGGSVLVLACLTPWVGWFGLFPFLLIFGLGAVLVAVYQRITTRSAAPEDDAPAAPAKTDKQDKK